MGKQGTITTSVILYKSKTLSNGEHPILVRITQNRKRKYFAIGKSCSENLWDFKNSVPKKSHPNYKLLKAIISKKIAEYDKAAIDLEYEEKDFTPDTLIQTVEKPQRKLTVFDFFKETIDNLIASNKVGNAGVYTDTRNCLRNFLNEKDIHFSEIDLPLLNKWETYQRKNGNLETALSVRYRTLRALYNKAIGENIAKESSYPFAKNKTEKNKFQVSKFELSTRKRAITKVDIKTIEGLDLSEDTGLFEARQYFLFSYYGLGINFIDIANLKWKNIIGNRIFYKRMKTGKELNFLLLNEAMNIINYWKPYTGSDQENFIFPILEKNRHITPMQIENRTNKIIGKVNKDLKEIGKKAKISTPLTTYVARHTMATVLKNSGTATAIISQAMGHNTEATTNTYLKQFENEFVDAATANL